MNSNKVHSRRTVPTFSWEEKPGVTKVLERKNSSTEEYNLPTDHDHRYESETFKVKLPPPPGPPEKYRASFHDLQIPPPPCAFQPPISRSSSRRKNDDPFLIAYKECTKSSKKDHKLGHGRGLGFGFGLKKNISVFSCKRSCSVVDDNIIKKSQLPISRSRRENNHQQD